MLPSQKARAREFNREVPKGLIPVQVWARFGPRVLVVDVE